MDSLRNVAHALLQAADNLDEELVMLRTDLSDTKVKLEHQSQEIKVFLSKLKGLIEEYEYN